MCLHVYKLLLLKSLSHSKIFLDNFRDFLNSLPCALQILVRVRELDVDQYIEQISESKQKENTRVYKDQIDNYCHFIKDLVSGNKILSRHFYVVIPYQNHDGDDFETIKEHINLTRDLVMKGLEKLGMRAKQLDSLEVLDLFYRFYNPSQTKTQELTRQTIKDFIENNYAAS